MRALVISDTHFGAWTGEDILREPENLALLEPHLDVDEVIFLGDLFDFLFASQRAAFQAADGLFNLLRERLQGRRLVFLAGNHDHHLITRAGEQLLELELLTGRTADQLAGDMEDRDFFRRFLAQRLEGVEIDVRYPTYTFSGVLLTHGHYLDIHAHRTGSAPDRLLSRLIWSIAVGGIEDRPSHRDYEASIQLLTELLYAIAQLPNGTHVQRRAYSAFETFERVVRASTSPLHALERLLGATTHEKVDLDGARAHESSRRRRTGAPTGGEAASFSLARRIRPTDPRHRAISAFEQVVQTLGWGQDTDKIVFAHTHQPLQDVPGPSGRWRYWNTGSWIYEPDLSSEQAYATYLRQAWPGTAILIDSEEPAPRLLELRQHLNPLNSSAGDAGGCATASERGGSASMNTTPPGSGQ